MKPICKKGHKEDLGNYRPFSMTFLSRERLKFGLKSE